MSKADRVVDILAGTPPVGAPATVRGWIRTRRDSKAGLSFLALHDGSCFDALQVVAPAALDNYDAEVLHLTAGCAVTVRGTVAESQGKGQSVELLAESVEVAGWVDDPDTYPISPKRHSFEYLREVAHLRSRTNTFGAVARVRHTLAMAIHRFFHENGFAWIHTPIITASDAEGAGELFRVSTLDLANLPRTPDGSIDYAQDFFGKPAFLTVSGQLNVETYCLALTNVYTFGPTFRAENSNTSRHLAEFWMVEPEIAFADIHDNADLAEDLLKYIYRALLDERADDMAFFAERIDKEAVSRLEGLVNSDFARMEYTEAIEVLERAGQRLGVPGPLGRRPPGRARALPVPRSTRSGRWWSSTTPRRSRRSTCASTTTGGPWRRWTCWPPASARSSAAASARSVWTCSTRGSGRRAWTRRPTGGTATCAATARCPTPASGWASTGPWPTPRAWRTSAT